MQEYFRQQCFYSFIRVVMKPDTAAFLKESHWLTPETGGFKIKGRACL